MVTVWVGSDILNEQDLELARQNLILVLKEVAKKKSEIKEESAVGLGEIEDSEELEIDLFESFDEADIPTKEPYIKSVISEAKTQLNMVLGGRWKLLSCILYAILYIVVCILVMKNTVLAVSAVVLGGAILIFLYYKLLGMPKMTAFIIIPLVLILGVFQFFESRQLQLETANVVERWVSSFTGKNYSECDNLVYSVSDLLIPDNIDSTGTYTKSADMYTDTLDAFVDSISDITYDATKGELKITYKVFTKADKVIVDQKKLDEVKQKYISNELSDTDMTQNLVDIYYSSFESTVLTKPSKTEKTTVRVVDVNDDKVHGVYNIVFEALEASNLYANMQLFEEEITSTINVMLRADE